MHFFLFPLSSVIVAFHSDKNFYIKASSDLHVLRSLESKKATFGNKSILFLSPIPPQLMHSEELWKRNGNRCLWKFDVEPFYDGNRNVDL